MHQLEHGKKTDGGCIVYIGSTSTTWGSTGDHNNDSIPDGVQELTKRKFDIENLLMHILKNFSAYSSIKAAHICYRTGCK